MGFLSKLLLSTSERVHKRTADLNPLFHLVRGKQENNKSGATELEQEGLSADE